MIVKTTNHTATKKAVSTKMRPCSQTQNNKKPRLFEFYAEVRHLKYNPKGVSVFKEKTLMPHKVKGLVYNNYVLVQFYAYEYKHALEIMLEHFFDPEQILIFDVIDLVERDEQCNNTQSLVSNKEMEVCYAS